MLYCAFKLTEIYPTEFAFTWSEGGHLDDIIGYEAEDGYYFDSLTIADGRFVSFVPRLDMLGEPDDDARLSGLDAFELFRDSQERWNDGVIKWMKGERKGLADDK